LISPESGGDAARVGFARNDCRIFGIIILKANCLARYFLAAPCRVWLDTTMVKARLFAACFCLLFALPARAFNWATANVDGRDYVTLQSFCTFYGIGYAAPAGSNFFRSRSATHSIGFKLGSPDAYIDGVHYVMSFPVESGNGDWLVSRMDVIKLFEPIFRPEEISGRHTIRGVVIDAGHGGSDNGAVSARGGMEKNYTLDTAYRLEAILRAAGLKTVLTRRNDIFVDLYERAHIASLYPDYCFVSIHYNSAEAEARGLETYCLSPRGAASSSSAYLTRADIYKLPGNDEDGQNILLASMVHSEIIRLNPGDPTADRGVKRARFVVIKANVLPAILVEGGFVSNRMEAARLNQAGYRQELAEAIARGVIHFANVMGDRHFSVPAAMPGEEADSAPAPRARPVAPAGLARDAGATTTSASPTATSSSSSSTTPPPHKTKKPKKVTSHTHPATTPRAATKAIVSAPTPPAATPPASATTTDSKPATNTSAPLNLAEPVAATPSPGADKAPPEPDEPPTVNIYPTTPAKSADAPGANTPGSAPAESATKPADKTSTTPGGAASQP
jgi:N-acetylmuramoyl-L-alanine amidase